MWFINGKVLLNPSSHLVPFLLVECHSTPTTGHFGYHKTLSRLRSDFQWMGMQGSVKEFLCQCVVCQQNKMDSMTHAGLLQPLQMPTQIWTDMSMDFIEGLPASQGHLVIMVVVVDHLSKYAHFIPMSHLLSAPLWLLSAMLSVFMVYRNQLSLIVTRFLLAISGCLCSNFKEQSFAWVPVIILNQTVRSRLLIVPWSSISGASLADNRDVGKNGCLRLNIAKTP